MNGRRTIGVVLAGGVLAATAAIGARAAQAPIQAPMTPQVADTAATAEETSASAVDGSDRAPRPFVGSLGAGLAEVRRLTEAEEVDAALALSERLLAPDPAARLRAWLERQSGGLSERALAWFDTSLAGPLRALGLDPGTSAERAEVHYARGVALRAAARASEAREAYGLVRGLGGAARPDAVYELGHIALVVGEGWRSEIPELAPPGAQPPAAPQPPPAAQPPGAAPGAKAPDEPDPLQEARRAYQNALEAFVERLRLDWRDADTRANVELVRRRLRELDELEQQRKEQQQQQKDQQQGQDPDQQQDPKQEQDQKDPQQQDPAQQDPEQNEQQQDPSEAEPEQPEEQPEPEAGEQSEEESPPEEQPEPTPEPEEGELTKEQLQRLQQLLEQNRKLNEELEKAFRQSSRGRTARDW